MNKKRERTQNWTPEEKRYLLELCEKSLDVLEDKKIDSGTSSLKGMTWIYIHERFGERFGLERDVQRLREQWRRMKGHAKNASQEATEKRGGGGISLTDAIRRSIGEPQGRVRSSLLQSPTSSTSMKAHMGGICEPGTSGCNGTIVRPRKQFLRNALQKGSASFKEDNVVAKVKKEKKRPPNTKWRASDSNSSVSDDGENDLIMDIKDEIIEPIIDIDESVPSAFSLNRGSSVSVVAVDQEADGNTVTESRPVRKCSDEAIAMEMFKLRKLEQKRRMEMMEKEHAVRMETLEIKRDTKRMKREILNASINKFADEAEAESQATSSVRFGSDQLGSMGSGAGKGGGGGGAIREAGGAFGKMEASREEEFFYKQQREQLLKLKTDLTDEISFHEEQVKRHQEAIKRHTQRVSDIENKTH